MKKLNKKVIIIVLIVILVIGGVLFCAYLNRGIILKYIKSKMPSTHIYDRNGSEIAVIPYEDTSFFDHIKSYYLASTLEEILNDIKAKENISEEEAEMLLSTSGSKIYTCMDLNIQNKLEEIYANDNNFESDKESSTIITDNSTGEILAIVGGRNKEDKIITYGEDTSSYNLNRATYSKREVGSILPLISVYAFGLNNGTFSLDSIYSDTPLTGNFRPINYYNHFKGDITIKEAIQCNSNIVKVKALQDMDINECYDFVTSFNINLNNDDPKYNDKNLAALALGGLTRGITLYEISAAYRTLLTDGIYKEPHFYSKIVDKKENIYLSTSSNDRELLKKTTCEDIKSCIKSTLNSEDIYLKYSSSTDSRDQWSIISNEKYTVSTWQGYDDHTRMDTNEKEAEIFNLKILENI